MACHTATCAPPPVGSGGSSRGLVKKIGIRLVSDKGLSRLLTMSSGETRRKIKAEMSRRGVHYKAEFSESS